MKDKENRKGQQAPGGEDDLLQTLFDNSGARERPPQEFEREAREVLYAEWKHTSGRRKKRRFLTGLAVAASLLVALGVMVRLGVGPSLPGPEIRLAIMENMTGTVRVYRDDGSLKQKSLKSDEWLMGQQKVATGMDSAIALRWVNGQSIRMDENTTLRLESSGKIQLESGRIYMDTARRTAKSKALSISTPAGQVRHIGTQFMTSVSLAGTTVSVRSGSVALEQSGAEHLVAQGEQLSVSEDGVRSIKKIDTWGEHWQWVERITPAFDSNGKSIADLLDWVGNETGHLVEYASFDAQDHARTTVLRGKLELEPMKALTLITQSSGMEAMVSGGLITVSLVKTD